MYQVVTNAVKNVVKLVAVYTFDKIWKCLSVCAVSVCGAYIVCSICVWSLQCVQYLCVELPV